MRADVRPRAPHRRSRRRRTEDIASMTVWMADRTQRAALNVPWLEMFPDP